jgi:hypothetical protein
MELEISPKRRYLSKNVTASPSSTKEADMNVGLLARTPTVVIEVYLVVVFLSPSEEHGTICPSVLCPPSIRRCSVSILSVVE